MYLASLYMILDLDLSLSSYERERILHSLRGKIKRNFSGRVVVRTDVTHTAIALAFFDDNYQRVKNRFAELSGFVEDAGEARLLSQAEQIFSLFEGEFVATKDSLTDASPLSSLPRSDKMIVYLKDEHEEEKKAFLSIGVTRKKIRIPTRK